MTLPAAPPATLIVSPEEAEAYLGRIGVALQPIYDGAKLGDLRAADVDTFHPRGSAGYTRWMATVGGLRRGMVDGVDWRQDDKLNRPTVERVDGKVTLSVIGCDAVTGDAASPSGPRAAHRRGPATIAAVAGQLELITVAALMGPAATASINDEVPLGQWFVLYHRGEDRVQLEVSKALGINQQTGQFTGWSVRVILNPYEPEPSVVGRKPLDVGGDDVDFAVVPAS